MHVIKAHAYGNDFLYARADDVRGQDAPALARTICDRHRGIGADGLILYRPTPRGATMQLLNADGSVAEVSGNGVRALAAIIAREDETSGDIVIETEGGLKRLTLLETAPPARYRFRAFMGVPADVRQIELSIGGVTVSAVALSIGNPQCVVLEAALDTSRLHALGPAIERHAAFPGGTNVEFATVEAPDRVRILIWERGVGPTLASGTGACAAAIAAAAFGGASRSVDVHSPGGVQRVEWAHDGVYLTGWAEIVLEGEWIGPHAPLP
jgi:diaminopimelate epimerase